MPKILRAAMNKGGLMFDSALLEKYRKMSDGEKVKTLDLVLDMDIPPLDMVVAFYTILKPQRAEDMAAKLKHES